MDNIFLNPHLQVPINSYFRLSNTEIINQRHEFKCDFINVFIPVLVVHTYVVDNHYNHDKNKKTKMKGNILHKD